MFDRFKSKLRSRPSRETRHDGQSVSQPHYMLSLSSNQYHYSVLVDKCQKCGPFHSGSGQFDCFYHHEDSCKWRNANWTAKPCSSSKESVGTCSRATWSIKTREAEKLGAGEAPRHLHRFQHWGTGQACKQETKRMREKFLTHQSGRSCCSFAQPYCQNSRVVREDGRYRGPVLSNPSQSSMGCY